MAKKNKYTNIDLSKYSNGYQASKQVQQAQKLKQQAENAVRNYGDFKYNKQGAYDSAMDAILNRKAFSYDLNGDAMYQQYKDMYTAQGKQAMMDTMGQAAALTGGYGNSYAASVGNQAYMNHMQKLGEVVPELYSLALSAYNTEGDRLNNNLNVLMSDRDAQYGQWGDKLNRLINDRGYYSDNYNNVYSQDYTKWNDQRNYDQSQYWNEYNAGYQKERDAVADSQWKKQYDDSRVKVTTSNAGVSDTSKVPDKVIKTIEGFQTNPEMSQYLNTLVASGTISQDQAKSLYAQYRLADDYFSLVDDGGINWGWGVDGNAVVRDVNGNTYTGGKLVEYFKKQGLSDKEAKKAAINLQKKLGV